MIFKKAVILGCSHQNPCCKKPLFIKVMTATGNKSIKQ